MNYRPDYEHTPPANYKVLTRFYDLGCDILGLGKGFKRKVLDSGEIKQGSSILDIGCGTGIFLEVAKSKFPNSRIIGIDPDEEALAIARDRLNSQRLTAELIHGYAEALPFSKESIDVCFSTLAFHHIPDELKHKALSEIYRVLKPAAKLLIADFGASRNWFLRLLLGFEEHVKGNFDGLVMAGLRDNNFRNIVILWKKWPGIQVISAQK